VALLTCFRLRAGQAMAACALALGVGIDAQAPLENDVKAVFLYNFAKYVDWPSAPAGSSKSLRMCVPANPQFLATLREAVQGETLNGRPLAATALDGLDGARECDILYVGDATTADAAAWLRAVRGRQTLTVGDGALTDGLVIAFVREQNRIRFDISRSAEAHQKLTISSRLLGLARRVEQP
jgi:hypothetical protein